MEPKKRRGRPSKKTEEPQNDIVSTIVEAKPKNQSREQARAFAEELVEATKTPDLTKFPLETVEDYREYNHEARRQKRPVKFPPLSMFPKVKTKIMRADGQKHNPLHVRIRDAELLLDYDEELSCIEPVEIPQPVVKWLNERAKKIYKQVKYPDGTSETVFSHYEPRFSCQMVM